jgi:hypothetical protein
MFPSMVATFGSITSLVAPTLVLMATSSCSMSWGMRLVSSMPMKARTCMPG